MPNSNNDSTYIENKKKTAAWTGHRENEVTMS